MANTAAALFDLDGVLVDSWAVAELSFLTAAAEIGVGEPPLSAFRAMSGAPLEVIVERLDLPPAIISSYRRCTRERIDSIRAFPGIADALAGLVAAGHRLGVVTAKPQAIAQAILQHNRLDHYVEAIVTPEDAPGKPDPRAVLSCLERLGAAAAGSFLVGDARHDMQAARRAGITAIYARWGPWERLEASDYDQACETPARLLDLVRAGG